MLLRHIPVYKTWPGRALLAALLVLPALAGCGPEAPTPTPVPPAVTATPIAAPATPTTPPATRTSVVRAPLLLGVSDRFVGEQDNVLT